MYGNHKYNRKTLINLPQVVHDSNVPTFVCSKCKTIKQLSSQYSDINLTLSNKTIACYRICEGCFSQLTTWMKQ
jgi:hypothetical protein